MLEILCLRRKDKISNLAFELGVDERTIRRDIEVLMLFYPIKTVRGRYDGGVRLESELIIRPTRIYISKEEEQMLIQAYNYLPVEYKKILIHFLERLGIHIPVKR